MSRDRDRQFEQKRREFSQSQQDGRDLANASFVPLAVAAGVLGCSVKTVRRWIDKGYLPAPIAMGGRVGFLKSELAGFVRMRIENREREVDALRERCVPLAKARVSDQAPEAL